ncbi:MurR/RpiR family transcriptional regulator [Oceanobacillus sojae]|uniref:RpiR family transcriptional regulator n=1 Tax=Oceanobacillus sojae TaxID=582851 RepID=A0A511ZHQ4_9BACI|nr:MurR/RpiR family transcriptional regulator [Oceanobacillus sojae]GEN86979.1 RpiR family transcriptional regulator [Oceanobacillus sojae]
MSLIESLKSQENFTKIEMKIANYTLNNLGKISRMTIKEYAIAAQVSEASVVRFCKQLGIKGFRDFKLELNQELTLKENKIGFNIVQKEHADKLSMRDIFFNTLELDRQAVEQLLNTLDLKNIESTVSAIQKSHTVVTYGAGASAMVAEDLTHKFTKLGIKVFFNRDFHYMLSLVLNMQPGDVFIAISTTGETQEILELVELAKEKGAIIVAVTTLQKSTLARKALIPLYTPMLEEYFRVANMATRISQLVVVDTLYMSLYEELGDQIIDRFYELRDSVNRFRR